MAKGQVSEQNLGFGIDIGAAIPFTDINDHKGRPFGRLFVKYLPDPHIGLEVGFGLGSLEAERGDSFFTSKILPIDARLLLQPIRQGYVQPYVFAGVGLMHFNPIDKSERPLRRNARGDYSNITAYLPVGVGAQIYESGSISLGAKATYHMAMSDNLDDLKAEGNDSYWSVGISITAFLAAVDHDPDRDSLLNDDERKHGTNPLNPDSDGDGLRDGAEVFRYKTDPLNPDTDGDGLSDGDEVLKYRTDPLNKDTDGDGLNDGQEVLTYRTDPLNKDTDGDGLTDGQEVLTHRTDPLKVDTDGDALGDGDEVLKHRTNPLNRDTDGDELTDGEEVLKHRTDPLKLDTDDGGVPDGKEVLQLATNPLDPSDDVPVIKVGERIVLEGVNFETAKTTLLPGAMAILDQVAAGLLANPSVEVAIHGHTDNVGGASYNMGLSQGRAESVKAYLVAKGVGAPRITTRGFGYTKPIADNATPEGRARNRRIEFVRIK